MPPRDIDTITALLRTVHPRTRVQQLTVSHPGTDDDGIWFFSHHDVPFEVQLESSAGTFPFLVESDRNAERAIVHEPVEASRLIAALLGLSE